MSYLDEVPTAGFRYALVRLRDAGTAVGMYRGERAEAALLDNRLSAVMTNYRRWLNRTLLFIGWNVSMSQAINPLPFVVQAQRLFAAQISLGGSCSPPRRSASSMTHCRSSATPMTSSPATAMPRSGSTGW